MFLVYFIFRVVFTLSVFLIFGVLIIFEVILIFGFVFILWVALVFEVFSIFGVIFIIWVVFIFGVIFVFGGVVFQRARSTLVLLEVVEQCRAMSGNKTNSRWQHRQIHRKYNDRDGDIITTALLLVAVVTKTKILKHRAPFSALKFYYWKPLSIFFFLKSLF